MRKWICGALALCLAAMAGCGGMRIKADEEWNQVELIESETGPAGEDDPAIADETGPAAEAEMTDELVPSDEVWDDETDDETAYGELATAEFSNPLVNTELEEDQVIVWNDAALEAAMRQVTGIESGTIMLGDLWGIVELDLSGQGIVDISALSGLSNLLWLDLHDNDITDVSALGSLSVLSSVDLSGNGIADLTPLSGLSCLTELNLSGNCVEDIRPLADMTHLSWLNLSGNAVEDVSALSGLHELMELNLSGNPVTELTPLSGLELLCSLNLSDTAVTDVTPLAAISELEILELTGTEVSSEDAERLKESVLWLEVITD